MTVFPLTPERLFYLKIAMIGQKDVPSSRGGIEVAVEALSVRMAAAGHQITLYNCRRCSPFKFIKEKKTRQYTYKGVLIHEIRVPDLKGISAVAGSFAATVWALREGHDCIHYHAEGPALMTVLAWLFHIPTVVTIHGLDWKRSKWGWFASWYLKLGEKAAAALADAVVVLSREAQTYFRDTYNRQTVFIPNGMEKSAKRDAQKIREIWDLEKDEYILYLGRIVPEKGLKALLHAFRLVKTSKKLVVAGSYSDTKRFYDQLVWIATLDKRIIFTGFVDGDIKCELYSNCYFYCLPSDLEGMPLSLLEAVSYGNCCLCSDIPECLEVTGNLGYRFKQGDTDDLALKLQMLCEMPELVEASRKRTDSETFKNFDWDQIAGKTLALYKEIIKSKRTGR